MYKVLILVAVFKLHRIDHGENSKEAGTLVYY